MANYYSFKLETLLPPLALVLPLDLSVAPSLLGDLGFVDCSSGSTTELEIINSSSLSDEAKLVMLALERILSILPSEVIIPLD